MTVADPVAVDWNAGTLADWQTLWRTLPRSTLTQSFGYAEAMMKTERAVPRLGLVRAGRRPVAMVQVLERRMLGIGRSASISRGPLWFSETPPDPGLVAQTFSLLRSHYPPGLVRWTDCLPELPAGPEWEAVLRQAGFRRAGPGYETIWVDLGPPESERRRRLRPNWRNHLNFAERAGLEVEADAAAKALPWLAERTVRDQRQRRYRGPSGPLLVHLRNAFWRKDGVLLLRAIAGSEPVAGLFAIRHGTSATWVAGWSAPEGRRCQAQTLLIWRMLETFRRAGVRWVDLGGINPTAAPGLTRFKRGIGGAEVSTVGRYA